MTKMLYVDEPKTDLQAVDFFIQEASKVEEYDYGDCMREWNRELLYLKAHLQPLKEDPWLAEKLNDMQMYIQFVPNWDVDSTKERILKDSHEIREHVILAENAGRAA
jgi:hypothetical protein